MMMGQGATPENIRVALTELKAKYPKIKNIVGGSGQYEIDLSLFDFVNTDSFAEDSLLKLLDELSSKSLKTKLTRKKFSIESHRFIYKEHDCILPGETLPIEWGRGCIFQCPFCRDPNLGKKPGTDEKNVDLMVDEFVEMYERFGTTAYYFLDETFNASSDRLQALEKVYNTLPFKLEFLAYNRADLLDAKPYTQEILHNCGQRGALFGIETFNPIAAKRIGKSWSAKRGKDFLLELRDKWPRTHIDVSMISMIDPETTEELSATADWLMNSNLGFYWFLPLTLIADQPKGVWEIDYEEVGLRWPDPVNKPLYWEWGNTNHHKAYHLSATLNRRMRTSEKYSMWTLGPLKTIGLEFDQTVNKKYVDVIKLSGDLYDQETRLFNMYKEKLKSVAGR
jgi:radical SAM superfamily enzyme YgiQ (UPF0313 family)